MPLVEVAGELQAMLKRTGHYQGAVTGTFDEGTRKALRALVGVENLEERWNGEGDQIDRLALEFLREKFGNLERSRARKKRSTRPVKKAAKNRKKK